MTTTPQEFTCDTGPHITGGEGALPVVWKRKVLQESTLDTRRT